MKKNLIITMLAFIGVVSLSFTTADDGITLRLRPKQGASYTVKTKTSSINVMEVMGQNMTVSQTLESRQSFTIKDVKPDECTIESQIESMKFSTTQMGMTFTYDSEHPEDTSPMIADAVEGFSESMNQPVTMQFNQYGNFVFDSINPVINQLGNIIIDLPEEEVTVGSQWVNEVNQSVSGIDINTEMTYTVTKITKKAVEVSMTGQFNLNDGVGSGSYEGTASIDLQTGMVVSSTTKSNIRISITEQGLTIPVTMTGTTTITVE